MRGTILLLMPLLGLATAQEIPLKVLVVMVQWSNHANRALLPKEQMLQLWNGPGFTSDDLIPGESINDWMKSNSYGKYKIEAEVVDWFMVPETEKQASGFDIDIEDILLPALENAAANGYDMKKYANKGNDIRGVVFAHSGYDALLGGEDCETGASYQDRVVSKAWGTRKDIGNTGYSLISFSTMAAYRGKCDLKLQRIGVPIHEWLHASIFQLYDLYDLGGRYGNSNTAVGGIGSYGIMSFPGGQRVGKFQYPGILCPYHRMEIGALEPIEITQDGIFTARASAIYKDVYRISEPYPDGEYLLIENRQPVLSDIDIWKPGGILIWHIDENVNGVGNTYRGGPFQEGWPRNGNHYKVALLQADGAYELEMAMNMGHLADFWQTGQSLGPGNGESVATDEGTYPNTDSYAGGNIQVTGLVIDLFQDLGDGIWSFRVNGLVPGDPTSKPSKAPSMPTTSPPPPTLSPTKKPTKNPTKAPTSTPPPTKKPTPTQTIKPTPTLSPSQCLVEVSTTECNDLMSDVTPVQECDCYNFCSGVQIECCPFGNDCSIDCRGDLVAGCQKEPAPAPSMAPHVGERCLLNVNTQDCEAVMSGGVTPIEDCDCYNFCDGQFHGCCKENTPCSMFCDGDVIAGCSYDGTDTIAPVTLPSPRPVQQPIGTIAPVTSPTPQQPVQQPVQQPSNYYFWPDGFF